LPHKEENDEEMDPPTNEEAQNTQENIEKGSVNHEVLGTTSHTSRNEMIIVAIEVGDSKYHCVSESSVLDKQNLRTNEGTELELVIATP